MKEISVADVMTHLVVTLRPKETVQAATRRLLHNRISGAPVVEDGRLKGIVSEADLLGACRKRAPWPGGAAMAHPLMFLLTGAPPPVAATANVEDVMTQEVITTSPDASVSVAASLIDRHGIRRLPVVDRDGYLVGIVARADLVRAMVLSGEDVEGQVPA